MSFLHSQFHQFVDGATNSVSLKPEQVDEAGTCVWELVACPEQRKALLHQEQSISRILQRVEAILEQFINAVCIPLARLFCGDSFTSPVHHRFHNVEVRKRSP
jgi:hypothetical protein